MYNVKVNFDNKTINCYNTQNGIEELIQPNTSIKIDSIKNLSCINENKLIAQNFTDEEHNKIIDEHGNEVLKLYDDMIIIPVFNSYIQYEDNLGLHQIDININDIPYNILSKNIDLDYYSIEDSKLYNLATKQFININEPLKNNGIYSLILSPIITFSLTFDKYPSDIIYFKDNERANKVRLSTKKLIDNNAPPSVIINESYQFLGWTSDYGNYGSIDLESLQSPITFTPIIKQEIHNVTFKGCGSDVQLNIPHNMFIKKSTNSTFKNINCSKEGYTFNGWKESFTNKSNYSLMNIILCIISVIIIAYILIYIHKLSLSNIWITKSRNSQTRK